MTEAVLITRKHSKVQTSAKDGSSRKFATQCLYTGQWRHLITHKNYHEATITVMRYFAMLKK